MGKKARVILRHADGYESEHIRTVVREGLDTLGLRPFGRTLIKPNLVATGDMFKHAFTRPEFMEGVINALYDRGGRPGEGSRVTEIAVGERCGITVPTRTAFADSGYNPLLTRLGVKRYCFEEEQQVEIPLTHTERLRDYIYVPEAVAKADFFVNCPKFKAHPWTTVTFSLKAYIGIQDDRHRLIDHDHRLDNKIADLQHVLQPQFICIDAITAGEGRMLTPIPFDLNLVIMGENQVAFDAVCCHIIGVDPMEVPHIRLAHEQGFGPVDLNEIEVLGDVPLGEAKERAQGFSVGLVRVEKYFEGTNISAYAGPPPGASSGDARDEYCWGGCPGAIEEAIEILRAFDKKTDERMSRLHVVFGAYEGPIDALPGDPVVFIGDCASYRGDIHGKPVHIESVYQDRSTKDPHHAKHDDIYVKLASVMRRTRRHKADEPLRFGGCPVSVAEQVLVLVQLAGLKNPILDPKQAYSFNRGYLAWRSASAVSRAFGKSYQKAGPIARGAARPNLPWGT